MPEIVIEDLIAELSKLPPLEQLKVVTERGCLSGLIGIFDDLLARLKTSEAGIQVLKDLGEPVPNYEELPECAKIYGNQSHAQLLRSLSTLSELQGTTIQVLAVLCSDGSSGSARANAREIGRNIIQALEKIKQEVDLEKAVSETLETPEIPGTQKCD